MAYGDPNPPEIEANCTVGPWVPGMTLTENFPETIPPLAEADLSQLRLKSNPYPYISVYSDEYASALEQYFTETTMSWVRGDSMLYRPGLLAEDVWKYDISGESDYGLVEPPINEPNYDLFDSNWSAQFLVFARSTNVDKLSCKSLNLDWCSYGVVDNPKRGTDDDIYINCPAKNSIPKEPEPTYLDLYKSYKDINECSLIENNLGKQYLGCIWNEPNHPCSCNCPEQGVSFGDYLSYTRTYSTFWETPHYAPLYRQAQIGQLKSNIIEVKLGQISKDLSLGDVISIENKNMMKGSESRSTDGLWLITSIEYKFRDKEFSTILELMRDTNKYKTNKMGWSSPIYIQEEDTW